MDNLLSAWQEFLRGKRDKIDVQRFSANLIDNIILLHQELANGSYRHGAYYRFSICDPKPRVIHKASVRDRLLHHAIHRVLYPFFDRKFITDSFSCRIEKGTHRAMDRFQSFDYEVSKNHTKTCWVLKCDIKKFFDSINHDVSIGILRRYIADQNLIALLSEIITGFSVTSGKGLPLGNLTSQLFANIYMNELDQFIKHELRAKYYIRYADDFVLLSTERGQLVNYLPRIENFLQERLKLSLHSNKVFIQAAASGVDFLGWVHFADHRVLRRASKRRMIRRIKDCPSRESLHSYFGLLRHGNAKKACWELLNNYPVWRNI